MVFFVSCNTATMKQEAIVQKIIFLKEHDREPQLKAYLWKLDITAMDEPFKSIVLLEKKWYFNDASPFSKKYENLELLVLAKKMAFDEDYIGTNNALQSYLKDDEEILNNGYLSSYFCPFMNDAIQMARIGVSSCKHYYENESAFIGKDLKSYFDLWKEVYKVMELEQNNDYYTAALSAQVALANLLQSKNNSYQLLKEKLAYYVYTNKANNNDLSYLDNYYALINTAKPNTYVRQIVRLFKQILLNIENGEVVPDILSDPTYTYNCNLISLMACQLGQVKVYPKEYEKITLKEISKMNMLQYSFFNDYLTRELSKKNGQQAEVFWTNMHQWENPATLCNYLKGYKFEAFLSHLAYLKTKCEKNTEYCTKANDLIRQIEEFWEINNLGSNENHNANFICQLGIDQLNVSYRLHKDSGRLSEIFDVLLKVKGRRFYLDNAGIKYNELDPKTRQEVIALDDKEKFLTASLADLTMNQFLTAPVHGHLLALQKTKLQLLQKKAFSPTPINDVSYSQIKDFLCKHPVSLLDISHDDQSVFVLEMNAVDEHFYRLPFSLALKDDIARFKSFCSGEASSVDSIKLLGKKIYDHLFSSCTLDENTIICPSGLFYDFPFAALSADGEHYLIEKTAISFIDNIGICRGWDKKYFAINNASLFSFSDHLVKEKENQSFEELYFSSQELDNIAAILGRTAIIRKGRQCTKIEVKKGLLSDLCHLSLHGVSSPYNRHENFIVVRRNGDIDRIYSGELESYVITSKLVVLNACKTSIGAYLKGEGNYSLAASLLNKGVANVLATSANINDQSAKLASMYFYNSLKDQQSISQSLRHTVISLQQSSEFYHPYFWSGYRLYGCPLNNYEFHLHQ